MPEFRQGPQERSAWLRIASSGFDLAIVVVGATALGWWLDHRYGWSPWGTLSGALAGVVGGMVNFLRTALAASKRTGPGAKDG